MPASKSKWYCLRAESKSKRKSGFREVHRSASGRTRSSAASATSIRIKRVNTVYSSSLRRIKNSSRWCRKLIRHFQGNSQRFIRSHHEISLRTAQTPEQAFEHTSVSSIRSPALSQKRYSLQEGSAIPSEAVTGSIHKSLRFSHPCTEAVIPPGPPSVTTSCSTLTGAITDDGDDDWLDSTTVDEDYSHILDEPHLPGVNPKTIRLSYLDTMLRTNQQAESETQTMNRLDGATRRSVAEAKRPDQRKERHQEPSADQNARPPTLDFIPWTPSIGRPLTQALSDCNGMGPPVLRHRQHAFEVLACQKESKPELLNCPPLLRDRYITQHTSEISKRESYYPGAVPYQTPYVAYSPVGPSAIQLRRSSMPNATQPEHTRLTIPVSESSSPAQRADKCKGAADQPGDHKLDDVRHVQNHEIDRERQHHRASPSTQDQLPLSLCPAGRRAIHKPLYSSLPPTSPSSAQHLWHPVATCGRNSAPVITKTQLLAPDNVNPTLKDNVLGGAARTVSQRFGRLESHEQPNNAQKQQILLEASDFVSSKLSHTCEGGHDCDCNQCFAVHLHAPLSSTAGWHRYHGRCNCDCPQCLAAHSPQRRPRADFVTTNERRRKRDLFQALALKDATGVRQFLASY